MFFSLEKSRIGLVLPAGRYIRSQGIFQVVRVLYSSHRTVCIGVLSQLSAYTGFVSIPPWVAVNIFVSQIFRTLVLKDRFTCGLPAKSGNPEIVKLKKQGSN